MQPSRIKISLAIGALCLGAAGVANAASQSFDVTVTTLPDLSISEVTPLSYGTNVITTSGGTCTMDADAPGHAAGLQFSAGAGATAAAANFGDLTGTACVTGGVGTPGKYRVSGGLAGATVKITIAGVSNADFTFSPNNGCIVTYSGTTADDADSCAAYAAPPSALSKKLAAAAEDQAALSGGEASVAGELMFTVGGTITINQTLTPNQAYSQTFPVTVVY